DEEKLSRKVKDIPGWAVTPNNVKRLFSVYGADLKKGRVFNPSEHAVMELYNFIFSEAKNGVPVNVKAIETEYASDAGDNHGDMARADMLGWSEVRPIVGALRESAEHRGPAPYGSFKWIIDQRENERKKDVEDSWLKPHRRAI